MFPQKISSIHQQQFGLEDFYLSSFCVPCNRKYLILPRPPEAEKCVTTFARQLTSLIVFIPLWFHCDLITIQHEYFIVTNNVTPFNIVKIEFPDCKAKSKLLVSEMFGVQDFVGCTQNRLIRVFPIWIFQWIHWIQWKENFSMIIIMLQKRSISFFQNREFFVICLWKNYFYCNIKYKLCFVHL